MLRYTKFKSLLNIKISKFRIITFIKFTRKKPNYFSWAWTTNFKFQRPLKTTQTYLCKTLRTHQGSIRWTRLKDHWTTIKFRTKTKKKMVVLIKVVTRSLLRTSTGTINGLFLQFWKRPIPKRSSTPRIGTIGRSYLILAKKTMIKTGMMVTR